jgi:NarL family two-component system response regulator LiaR
MAFTLAEENESRMNGVINVAFTDDHRVVTHALRSLFELFQDIRVVGIAASGEELLKRVTEWTLPDVVVLDLLMPGGIDGVETTRRLLEMHPKIGVVALTASTDDARMTAVLRAGATGYVRKDAEPELLVKAVRAVAAGRTFVDPSVTGEAFMASPTDYLSPREIEVLREVALGRTNRKIGERLFISEGTVKTHVARVLLKLELQSRTQLVAYAVKNRYVDIQEL